MTAPSASPTTSGLLPDSRKAVVTGAGGPAANVTGSYLMSKAAAAFLLSDGAGYINGATIQIDGGKHMH
jgi:hypothetical protein